MLLEIDDHKHLYELQEKFNECFPFLKIEFYKKFHGRQQASDAANHLPSDALVGNVTRLHQPGILEIKSWYKTAKVEKDFKDLFGLHVQIFRLHNTQWVQTTGTDDLTLQEQSDIAQSYTRKNKPFQSSSSDDEEYDL